MLTPLFCRCYFGTSQPQGQVSQRGVPAFPWYTLLPRPQPSESWAGTAGPLLALTKEARSSGQILSSGGCRGLPGQTLGPVFASPSPGFSHAHTF